MNHGGLGLQLLVEICSQKNKQACKKVIGFHQSGKFLEAFKGGKISESIFIFVPFEEKKGMHERNPCPSKKHDWHWLSAFFFFEIGTILKTPSEC